MVSMSIVQYVLRFVARYVPSTWKPAFYDACIRSPFCVQIYPDVFRLPFGLLLKRGHRPESVAADALRLLNTLQGVRTPMLVNAVATSTKNYLLSNFIEGCSADDVWDELTQADRQKMARKLHSQFQLLHSQTMSSSHPICNASGQPIYDHRVPWISYENPRVIASSPEFGKEVWPSVDVCNNSEILAPLLKPFIQREWPVVFCHGDLLPKNIIIENGLEAWRAGHGALYLIDWEYAGWMPSYWDAVRGTWLEFEPDTDWTLVIRDVFPEHNDVLHADWNWRSLSGIAIV